MKLSSLTLVSLMIPRFNKAMHVGQLMRYRLFFQPDETNFLQDTQQYGRLGNLIERIRADVRLLST